MSIFLPFEEAPNPYITPELCFQFHYFAIRKMHFLMRAVALVSFPGGLGTLDELFEVLTLTQTRNIRRRPIVLIGRDFWERLINFDVLVEHGVISPEDKNLFHYAETAEEAWGVIKAAYQGDNPALVARQMRGNRSASRGSASCARCGCRRSAAPAAGGWWGRYLRIAACHCS